MHMGDLIDNDRNRKVGVPAKLREDLLEASYYSLVSGHDNINKTLGRVRQKYYWPGIVSDVQKLVSNCETCKCITCRNKTERPHMAQKTMLTSIRRLPWRLSKI